MSTRIIQVALGARSYDVVVGAGVLDELGARLARATGARAVLAVADDELPLGVLETAGQSLRAAGLRVVWCQARASEREKSIATAARLLREAAAARLERGDAIVALGGGVVGDVAGFAASIYRRGVAVVQCPTTLLSMVDASVGGKTGVNLVLGVSAGTDSAPHAEEGAGESRHEDDSAADRLLKNMVGTFHQPRLVLADVRTLATLPARHMRSGLAECIKHAMLGADFGDDAMLAAIESAGALIGSGRADEATLADLVARNVAIKASVVSADEFERGSAGRAGGDPPSGNAGREALNLGHTFGHALEAMEHLTPDGDAASAPLQHGEAVALGLIAAAATAEAIGQIPPGAAERVRGIVELVGLPSRVAGLPDDDAVIAAMMDDKKVQDGRLRLVLPWRELGRVRIADGPTAPSIAAGLAAIRQP